MGKKRIISTREAEILKIGYCNLPFSDVDVTRYAVPQVQRFVTDSIGYRLFIRGFMAPGESMKDGLFITEAGRKALAKSGR